jgi:hypothetical protein
MHTPHLHKLLQWLTLSLLLLSVGTVTYVILAFGDPSSATAYVISRQTVGDVPWVTFTPENLASGATVPADTNIVFTIPYDVVRITREVLLGHQGKSVRYWGYCVPEDYDPERTPTAGFPGKMFLSEAERRARIAEQKKTQPNMFLLPVRKNVSKPTLALSKYVKHKLEIFEGGMTCYLMTSQTLSIGIDADGDKLNSASERLERTDPEIADTDEDGVLDGAEVLTLYTDPHLQDTDADGLLDGIEDRNQNGRHDNDETDPTLWDTDRDGLCDGFCRSNRSQLICNPNDLKDCIKTRGSQWRGEDKNLDGVLDEGETDPNNPDTDGNGIFDLQEYFNCIVQRKDNC